ncbi:MAG: IPT/TIG domain-containing protein [Prevotellaceae bacterium]|jgi:sugar lactone lactonase YvrE|nr:IPT/TIG domain-containing protein [Prevotellaceae bacterium]
MKRKLLIFVLSSLPLLYAGCGDETLDATAGQYDPGSPVTVERFTPDSGGAATQLMIYGSNFGTDASKILLTVGGKQAAVVGCNGTVIYALVPLQVRRDTGWCDLALRVGEQDVALANKLHYTPRYLVSTIAGEFVNDAREGAIVDGTFEEARFNEPYWMAFDPDKNIYLIEENNGLRYIDFHAKTVSTKFRIGNGMNRPRTIAFTPGYDTMIIVNDASEWTDMGHAMLTAADNFTSWRNILNSKQCNGSAFHPVDHSYYFNSYEAAQVFKVTAPLSAVPWSTASYEELFRAGDVRWEFNIQFAPSGDFAYLVSVNQHYIMKSMYNWDTHKLERATDFAGVKGATGYMDGANTSARFNYPHQGAFDEDDNFYLCDAMNHCIRKITPSGIVTTFAGRPQSYGYVDGDLRTAQFDRPQGIAYDKESRVFYIADQKNRRVRVIKFE